MGSESLKHLLGEAVLADFLEPGPVRKGLPGQAYTDEAFFKSEQEKVFRGGWIPIGFVHELAEVGSVRPADAGGLPVVMVRGKDDVIRVFHNVCRHRGLRLVEEPCEGLRSFSCPYHAWAYGLDGQLLSAPHFGGLGKRQSEGFDYHRHGLVPVRSAIWHDWIFVNPDGRAPAFEEHVAPLERHIGDTDLSSLKPLFMIDSGELEANWKFVICNFIEPYHVPVAHPETAAGQPLSAHYMLERRGNLVGCGAEIDAKSMEEQRDDQGLCLDVSAWYLTLFPNFCFFVYFADVTQVVVMINTPLAPDRTHQRRVIYQLGDAPAPDAEVQAQWHALHEEVIAEDWAMLRRLQAGRASPVMADGGRYSPVWETSEHDFDHLVVAAMSD